MYTRPATFASVVALAIAVAACAPAPAAPGTASGQAANQAPLMIGDISAVTGSSAQYGEQIRAGEDLAVDEVNRAGGIGGRQVQIDHKDNASDKAQAIALFRQLAGDDNILAILGPNASPDAIATTPLANDAKVVSMVTGGAAPWPTEFGQWVFRVPVTNDVIIDKLVAQTTEAFKVKRAALIYASDQDYAVTAKGLYENAAKQYGVTIATVQTYAGADVDYSAQLTAIKNANVDAVFMSTLAENAGPMLRQAKQLGLSVKWVGDAGLQNPKFWELSQGAAEGAVTGTPFDPTSSDPTVKAFVAAIKAKTSADPTLYNAYGYDSTRLVLESLKSAGANPTRDTVRAGLAKIAGFSGVTGTISFPAGSGDAVRDKIFIVEMKDGAFRAFGG